MPTTRLTGVLANADRQKSLSKLGGMARPNGVVIVSERFWAFATTDGGLHEGAMPVRGSRVAKIPLVRGLLQLASSMAPLARGRGVARGRERLFLLAAFGVSFSLVLLPARLELPAALALTVLLLAWLFRGGTLRLHGAEHRAIAAAEQRRLEACWSGAVRPSRFSPRCGTNFAALALPVTVVAERLWPLAGASLAASLLVALLALAVTMELWKAVQHPSGLLRGLLLPGLALQRLTTREPELADTRVALAAVASVLRRELG
ncbi:MAG: DUF1385 domain-containing protein [Gaiellaceae bacterium MAG52_C11]|nr:DUF1385 domain-containing protein [Candidatus Gaiellasilicea maunaloa]